MFHTIEWVSVHVPEAERVPQRHCGSAGPERRGREKGGRASLVSEQEP